MQAKKVLDLINQNEIDLLKTLLTEEIYKSSVDTNRKKRYAAMKRYFKYKSDYCSKHPMCLKPSKLEDGKFYGFIDGYTMVITTEDVGDLELYDSSFLDYKAVLKDYSADRQKISVDFNLLLSKAQESGYKYVKDNFNNIRNYATIINDACFNIAYIDKAFSIINDGKPATVTYIGSRNPILIETSIGKAIICPFVKTDELEIGKIIDCEALYEKT